MIARRLCGAGSILVSAGKHLSSMYSADELYDDEVDDGGADRIDKAVTHVFVGVLEAVAWLVALAVVGALVGTDLESSPWFWVVLIALPLILAAALWLRRTRKQERIAFDLPERL